MVYVDKLRDWGWRLGASCHLTADTLNELHAFAASVGMMPAWFQNGRSGPHYDLTASRRAKAIQLGAVELGDREFIKAIRKLKESAA